MAKNTSSKNPPKKEEPKTPAPVVTPTKVVEPVVPARTDFIEPAAIITVGYRNNNSNKQEVYLSGKLYVVNRNEVLDVPIGLEAEFLRIKIGMWFKV